MTLTLTPGAATSSWKVTWDAKELADVDPSFETEPVAAGKFRSLPEAPSPSAFRDLSSPSTVAGFKREIERCLAAPAFDPDGVGVKKEVFAAALLPLPLMPTRSVSLGSAGTSVSSEPDSVFDPLLHSCVKNPRYKTEMCRNFKERAKCIYGEQCQFAHGRKELRDVVRNTKYKTKPCQKYWLTGYCAYGPRCNFLHNEFLDELPSSTSAQQLHQRPPPPTSQISLLTAPFNKGSPFSSPSDQETGMLAIGGSTPNTSNVLFMAGIPRHSSIGHTPFKTLPHGVRRMNGTTSPLAADKPRRTGFMAPNEDLESVFAERDIFSSIDNWNNELYEPSENDDSKVSEESKSGDRSV